VSLHFGWPLYLILRCADIKLIRTALRCLLFVFSAWRVVYLLALTAFALVCD
jgi:hypothetical protein